MRYLIICLLFVCSASYCQNTFKKYVKNNLILIKYINPDSTNFSDLEVLGQAIGNSRIVMLGEQDHGDAATFLAKTRIIKYLHEVKGFNVLAFESDFYSVNKKQAILDRDNILRDKDYFKYNVMLEWTLCNACDNLFKYISSTKTPIKLSGFDSQLSGNYAFKNFKNELDSILSKKYSIPFSMNPSYKSRFLPLIDSFFQHNLVDSSLLKELIPYTDTIESQLLKITTPNDFWYLCLKNLQQSSLSQMASHRYKEGHLSGTAIRDRQMAANLNWISHVKYPNEKIIVWAANAHIVKNYSADTSEFQSMGTLFANDSINLNSTYVLTFTSKNGVTGRATRSEHYLVPLGNKKGLENMIPNSVKYGFLDLKPYTKENVTKDEIQFSKIFYYSYPMDLKKMTDGIFYIKTMFPCNSFKK